MTDRIELKELVDLFSNYSDTKDIGRQVELFTEDGVVNIINDGKTVFTLAGHKQIFDAFNSSMSEYSSVFHMSGQQTVEFIDDSHANGIAYNLVALANTNDEGELITLNEGVRYEDEYKKINGKWLIAERNSNFVWRTENIK